MRLRLPIPSNWQDFEALCHLLWKEIWCDPNAQRNGRAGQAQAGVDVFGRPIYKNYYAGVQCKDKDGRLGSTLSEKQLLEECSNARTFTPALNAFTLATTAASDQAIQTVARNLNANHTYPFDVHVWSWDEIEAEISCRPTLIKAFYPSAPAFGEAPNVKIAVSAPKDQFFAFFSRPNLVSHLGHQLKESLVQLTYELCDNAFSHGGAHHIELSFDGVNLQIKDDGKAFNPIANLDSTKASRYGNLGSYVLDAFRNKYGNDVDLSYHIEETGGKRSNVLTLEIQNGARATAAPEVLELPVDLSAIFGRRGAQGLADTIVVPNGVKEVVITVTDVFNISGTVCFIHALRERLPPSVLISVSHPREGLVSSLSQFFNASSVRFQAR
jgi:hypothetical protein